MNMHILRRGMIARPAKHREVASSLVRRLVEAQDDPAKHRIRGWLRDLDDAQLSSLGLASEDIAVLRDTQSISSSGREPVGKQANRTTPLAIGHSGRIRRACPERDEEEAAISRHLQRRKGKQ